MLCVSFGSSTSTKLLAISRARRHAPVRRVLTAAATTAPTTESSGFSSQWSVYKSKGAVAFKPIPPTWKQTANGLRFLEREGTLLCEFANATAPRAYDWAAKQTFALSAAELGDLLLLGSHETTDPVKLFHDPNKGTSAEGQMSKTLAFNPAPNGDYFMNLTVIEKPKQNVQISVSLSKIEMRVLRSLAEYCIPRFMGFDKIFEQDRMAA